MKRLVAFMMVILLMCMSVVASAENFVNKYTQDIKGSWKCVSFSGVMKNSEPAFYWLSDDAEINLPGSGNGKYTNYNLYLVGDETGEVYLVCETQYTTSAGRVYLSQNGKNMLVICPNNAMFFFRKVK